MRQISICSIEELRHIILLADGFDHSLIQIRDILLPKYSTLEIITESYLETLKYSKSNNVEIDFIDHLLEYIKLEIIPRQFIIYNG